MKKKHILPNKPSALLRLAVGDAKKIERTPGYRLNMSVWHTGAGDNSDCEVCLAGSVMACTLKLDRTRSAGPGHADPGIEQKLNFINDMREGNLDAIENAVLFDDDGVKDKVNAIGRFISNHYNFGNDRAPWWVYLKAADRLEALGF